ncbi:MAG: RnfABCDGE type electron transport complex subunit D [Chitinispirillaceae bacterium]|nr:RnfABCDGE type electron transport complex subunit D [Chitinispirillaceae bacterium]
MNAPKADTLVAVSAPPHLRGRDSVPVIMLVTIAALMPALIASAVHNGPRVLLAAALSMAAAAVSEWAFRIVAERRMAMIDGSAGVTGLLLACTLPPQVPLWVPPLGALFAVAVVKMAFGGLGRNFLNPALAGRAFCVLVFPAVFGLLSSPPAAVPGGALSSFFLGGQGGWIGGSSAGALLAGAAVLRALRIIDMTVPLSFLASSFILFWLAGEGQGALAALAQAGTGGMLLCALFMATDPVTSPKAFGARLLFGCGCGALAFCFRDAGTAGDGAMYAVLLMNCFVPYCDRYCGRLLRRRPGRAAP